MKRIFLFLFSSTIYNFCQSQIVFVDSFQKAHVWYFTVDRNIHAPRAFYPKENFYTQPSDSIADVPNKNDCGSFAKYTFSYYSDDACDPDNAITIFANSDNHDNDCWFDISNKWTAILRQGNSVNYVFTANKCFVRIRATLIKIERSSNNLRTSSGAVRLL